jgi:hypothetical protein
LAQDGKNLQSSIHAMLDVGTELLGKGTPNVTNKNLYENHGLSVVVIWKPQATLVWDLFTSQISTTQNQTECEIDGY